MMKRTKYYDPNWPHFLQDQKAPWSERHYFAAEMLRFCGMLVVLTFGLLLAVGFN